MILGFNSGEQLIINRHKIDWETLNTPKIKTVFYSERSEESDYGTRIRFKCHKPIQRKTKTLEAELCTNWDIIDSFGVNTDGYKKFYDDPDESWWSFTVRWRAFIDFSFLRKSHLTLNKA